MYYGEFENRELEFLFSSQLEYHCDIFLEFFSKNVRILSLSIGVLLECTIVPWKTNTLNGRLCHASIDLL